MLGNRYGVTAESLMDATADAMASHGLGIYLNDAPWFWVVGHWHAEMLGRAGLGSPPQHPGVRLRESMAHPRAVKTVGRGERPRSRMATRTSECRPPRPRKAS